MDNRLISIIIPVYKAKDFIKENLETIKSNITSYFPNNEIIAVIDGDNDTSYKEAKKVNGIKVVGYTKNRGKGYALKYGFKYANGAYVTFMDCDMDFHPAQLRNFIPYMETADIVIGSKRHPFSKLRYPLSRKFLSKAFHLYSKLVLGVGLTDTQSGFKMIKREVLEVLMPLVVVKRFAFDLELMFLAQLHGFRTVEAPIHINQDFSGLGVSTGTLSIINGMFFDVLGIRYRYSISKYYQKKYHKVRFTK